MISSTIITSLSACALGGYLIGSIPFGLVLCYLAGYGDIRKIGSGNIGATNVLRTGNKLLALLTVILDACKAGLAAFVALKVLPTDEFSYVSFWQDGETYPTLNVVGALVAGFCGFLGHNFPVWLKFKGGKGVSSAFGLILFTQWPIALIALGTWLVMAFTFRYSSLSALTAAAIMPFVAFFMCSPIYFYFYAVVALIIIVRHHANIARLLSGQESKISFKKKA